MQSLLPFMLSEPVGLASSIFMDVGDRKFAPPLNLLPSSKLSSLGFQKKKPYYCLASCIFALLPLPGLLKSQSDLFRLNKSLAEQKIYSVELSKELSAQKKLQNKFIFVDRLANAIVKKNLPFVEKQQKCWQIYGLLNELQGSLDHEEVDDAWIDNFEIMVPPKNDSIRSVTPKNNGYFKIKLSGRYLVKVSNDILSGPDSEKRNALIDLNSKKQAALTTYINNIPLVKRIERKIFSIEGKGDLFGKYFTHFEYQVSTSL
jgi:hypothetical protein